MVIRHEGLLRRRVCATANLEEVVSGDAHQSGVVLFQAQH